MIFSKPAINLNRLKLLYPALLQAANCRLPVIMSLFLVLGSMFSHAQGDETFGQNRVQYKSFTFSYYESDNFITYYYQGGQDIAKYVIKAAEDNSDEISKMLDYRYKRKIDIIIYNTITELNQTNIGIYEPNQNAGGTVNIPEGKMFVYFNGDHANLDKQIREGIARIYVDRLVAGTTFGEKIQNAVLLNLPDWYRVGLVRYIGEPWNSSHEDRLRDGILSGRFQKLNKLQRDDAIFVGHSIWHYLEEVHGKSTVNNILYLTRINRSVDNGFMFVLGTNLNETLKDWYTYYFNRYSNEGKMSGLPAENTAVPVKPKKGVDYYQTRLSADGKHVAWASNDMGRYKIHLLNTETGKRKVLFRGGWRTNTMFTDQSLPLLAWDPNGKRLAWINERRSNIFIRFYDVEKKKTEKNPIRKFQKVVGFNFTDSKQLVISGIQNGQTDIFLYNIASTTTRKLTDDYYDDLYPAYVTANGIKGIMFSSNRTGDTLEPHRYESQVMEKQMDLFFYDLDANRNILYRITNTPLANETYPQNLNDSMFCFLSDDNGVRNRYAGSFNSVFDHNQKTVYFKYIETGDIDSVQIHASLPAISALDTSVEVLVDSSFQKVYKIGGVTTSYTNYTYNIQEQTIIPQKGLALDMYRFNNKVQLRKYPVESTASIGKAPVMDYMLNLQNRSADPTATAGGDKKKIAAPEKTLLQIYDSIKASRGKRPFDFQSEFDFGIKLFDWDSASSSKLAAAAEDGYVFRFSKVRPYFIRFSVDKVIAQLDNNIIMNRYQPFDPASAQFQNQPMSFMIKVGITDLLENHKLYGGFRFPFVGISNNSEYFITYENLTKRLDTKFTFYRRSLSNTAQNQLPFVGTPLPQDYSVDYSIKTNYAELQLKYAIDVLNSLRFGIGFRHDKIVYKAKDRFSLELPAISDNWLTFRTEYVFDNCMEVATNIRYGLRFKVFGEVQKQFPTKNKTYSNDFDIAVPQFNKVVLSVFGLDLRHYLKVYKQIIWANRLAMGASFGTAKMIYYAGGLDNWITTPRYPKWDVTTPINYNNGYAFQTLATPIRGFKQNARNGDKFVVINSELRVPIFAALINSPIKAEFIRNFQIVAFVDVGTAWEGATPWSGNNPLFSEVYPNPESNPSVIVKLQRYKNPVIMGFGPGVRTSLFGYFLRFDTAWGYDSGQVSKTPAYYFSFGLDF
jgi:hypothetical protein